MKHFPSIRIFIILLIISNGCGKDENDNPHPIPGWERISVFPHENLTDIEFYSNNFGVTCGYSGAIFITENGGIDWQSHKKGEGCFTSVFVLNENTFFTGRECVYKISNGATSYIVLGNESVFGSTISDIHFFDSDNGLVAASSYIFKTSDGGINWEAIYEKGFAHKFQFVTDSVGYIYGGATMDNIFFGELYRTDNRGNSWSSLGTTPEVYNWEILAMHFVSKDTGYMANYNHEVFYTCNGGISWTKRSDSLPTNIYDMVFVSENEGYGVGFPDIGILKTTDGGITWSWDYKEGTTIFETITKTPDNKKVLAVGSNGVIIIKKI